MASSASRELMQDLPGDGVALRQLRLPGALEFFSPARPIRLRARGAVPLKEMIVIFLFALVLFRSKRLPR
jgi:hypothetical protein